MRFSLLASIGLAGFAFSLSTGAFAHVTLTKPLPRVAAPAGNLKSGPCGQTVNGPVELPEPNLPFAPGETITVEWDEYIDHPGFFRVALDAEGDDNDFPLIANMDNVGANYDPTIDNPLSNTVLAYYREGNCPGDVCPAGVDGPDKDSYSIQVKLPNITCEHCTLQLIQFMSDKQNDNNDDEFYYQCADIVIQGPLEGSDAGVGGSSSEGGAGGSEAGGAGGAGGSTSQAGSGGTNSAGGNAGSGGTVAAAGNSASGGNPATGGSSSDAGASSDPDDDSDGSSDDGGCAMAQHHRNSSIPLLGFALALFALGRRKRHW